MKDENLNSLQRIVAFKDKKIRRIVHNDEWWFSIIDVIEVLTGSPRPRKYWSELKLQLTEKEGYIQSSGNIGQLKLESTDEWKKRGVKENVEYGILTAEISKATFGMTPSEYKDHRSLQKENLRDQMTGLELIFTMLGEASTTEIACQKDARGFDENKTSANKGGTIAGNARRELEKETGAKVISSAKHDAPLALIEEDY